MMELDTRGGRSIRRPNDSSGGVQAVDSVPEQREHELTMHIFALSAGLVGVCIIVAYALA